MHERAVWMWHWSFVPGWDGVRPRNRDLLPDGSVVPYGLFYRQRDMLSGRDGMHRQLQHYADMRHVDAVRPGGVLPARAGTGQEDDPLGFDADEFEQEPFRY